VITRLGWLLVASAALAVLLTARSLTPAAEGHGTHVALGLPPCGFRAWTGLPCPTCGLTTAFTLLAHGELLLAIRAQPLGVPLFLGAVASALVAAVGLVRGDSMLHTLDRLRADRWVLLLVIALLLSWLATLASRLAHGEHLRAGPADNLMQRRNRSEQVGEAYRCGPGGVGGAARGGLRGGVEEGPRTPEQRVSGPSGRHPGAVSAERRRARHRA
jgi:hypothetical protein